jgi:F-box-like
MDLSDISLFRRDLTPADIACIKVEISLNNETISSIDVDIESVRCQLEQLRKKRFTHTQLINRCKGALTLARRIPPELLAKIFEHSAETWALTPFIVSQVCAAWRRAAQMPTVWSHISINCDIRDPVGRARFWLQMAQQAPLYITIVGANLLQTHLVQIVDLLLCRASQWRTLTLDLTLMRDTNYVLSQCTCIFPSLRSVYVMSQAAFEQELDGGNGHLDGLQQSFLDSPNFRHIEIVSNTVPTTVTSHISNLSLTLTDSPVQRPLSVTSLLQLLEGLPCLKCLKITMPVEFERPFISALDPSLTVILPQLESLTLEDAGGLSWILRHFRAPALTRLRLRTPEAEDRILHEDDTIGTAILDFLKVSSKVQLFELHNIDVWEQEFASWFALLPELRDLRLHDSDIDDEALRRLYGRGGLCPRLSRIDLRWCHHVRGTALVELVRSRQVTGEIGSSVFEGAIDEVAALHCSLVRKQDVISLAKLTRLRVVFTENDDYCRKFYTLNFIS